MAIKLQKSQGISLKKDNGDKLKEIILGIGWKEGIKTETFSSQVKKKGLLNSLLGKVETVINTATTKVEVDLDAVILAYKGRNFVGECSFRDRDLYCKNVVIAHSMGDDRTGGNKQTDTDNEQIKLKLDKVDTTRIDKFYLIMNIYSSSSNGQTLNMVNKAYCKVYDDKHEVKAQFDLTDDFGNNTGVLIGEIVYTGDGFDFNAIGEGYKVSSIDDFKNKLSNLL